MVSFGKPLHSKTSYFDKSSNGSFECWGEIFKITLVSLIIAELLSFLGYLMPIVGQIAFFGVLILALILALTKLEFGLYVLLAELFVGSKGYLFALEINGTTISIRVGLFLIIFSVWLWQRLKEKDYLLLKNNLVFYYLTLFIFIFIALILGIRNNESSNVFFDFNAWLFFILIFVFFDLVKNKELFPNIIQVLIAATSWLAAKTVLILFLFSRAIATIGDPFYQWIRDSGVGEITYISGSIFRVFFQSHFYVLIGFLVILASLLIQKKYGGFSLLYLYCSSLAVVISQSRSFWLGGLAGLFILIILAAWKLNFNRKKIALLILILALFFSSQLFLIQLITGNLAGGAMVERFKNLKAEPASISRLNQLQPLVYNIFQRLFFGYGFGKELTYKSNDPRILQSHPGGIYTTYAFEWGYLDIWLKLGLVGLFFYLLLIYKITKSGFKKLNEEKSITIGLLAGLFALLVINIFSPYLNHPIGIGYLMLLSATFINNN